MGGGGLGMGEMTDADGRVRWGARGGGNCVVLSAVARNMGAREIY